MSKSFDEHTLFVALHTCAYRAMRKPRTTRVTRTERMTWLRLREAVRAHLVQRNLGLVYHALRHFRINPADRDDLASEGMLALVRSVDRFDPFRGVRFSTYAYNAITRAIARGRRRSDQQRRFYGMPFEAETEQPEREDTGKALFVDRLRVVLDRNLGELTEREVDILRRRFPGYDQRRLTLEEIGADCGLSKERVRQIQNRALRKLRDVLEVDPMLQ